MCVVFIFDRDMLYASTPDYTHMKLITQAHSNYISIKRFNRLGK